MTSKKFFKLSILSAFLFVASCSSIPSKKAEQDTYDRGTLLDTISKMDAIANVLGCALAPASEDCKKFKIAADIDPNYKKLFTVALKNNLKVICYDCKFSSKGIKLSLL